MSYSQEILDLPIGSFLDNIVQKLINSPSKFLILTAQTAAGKSTGIPFALINNFPKKIYMLEPRRLAVLNIAQRVSSILGEAPGQTCGYQMHLENCLNENTKLNILTEAILTRKLQSDPTLEDASVIVLDEFHERSIHSDLCLAFLKEAVHLRDDLFVLVMSATMNGEKISNYLGGAEILEIPGKNFPVQTVYKNIEVLKSIVEETNELQSKNQGGAILVFLPGIFEIRKIYNQLIEKFINQNQEIEILILHSSINFEEQKKVLKPVNRDSKKIRIILSSSIAETSLTVPDVKVVIDSGYSRINYFNPQIGMETLETRVESVFSAEQRKGRAGRVGPGKCVRLWNEYDKRIAETPPEILRSDLMNLVLECAEWGSSNLESFDWLDKPNLNSWNECKNLLEELELLKDGKITQKGKAVLKIGIGSRLGCVALEDVDTAVKFSPYAGTSNELKFKNDLIKRVKQLDLKKEFNQIKTEGQYLLEGFPDRLGVLQNDYYIFKSGRIGKLKNMVTPVPNYIVATNISAGDSIGTIFEYSVLKDECAVDFLNLHSVEKEEIKFNQETKKINKSLNTCYGKIVLKTKQLKASPEDYGKAICNSIEESGLEILPVDNKIKQLIIRAKFYGKQANDCSYVYKVENLNKSASQWLLPFVNGQSVTTNIVFEALYWYLDGTRLDKTVPCELQLTNGRKRKITYEQKGQEIQPVLEIIIQQIFGIMETPEIFGVPVLLKLLSPARRPLQITNDLKNFWKNTWPEICKEMKGRYPKHNWDYTKVDDNE